MRKRIELPSCDYIRSSFIVLNGVLCFRDTLSASGGDNGFGYSRTYINGKYIMDHRLVFKMWNGHCPDHIDHIDGVRNNNSIKNLRDATHSQNQWNMRIRKTEFPFKGVYMDKRSGRYGARIKKYGKMTYLGMYNSIIDAAMAYDNAAIEMFGDFAMTNKSLGAY